MWLCLFSVSLWFPYSLVDSHNLYVPLGQDKGYGFIGNDELKQRFNGMDVFLVASNLSLVPFQEPTNQVYLVKDTPISYLQNDT